LLTGPIGVGKTTIVMAVISRLKVPVGGFVTERVFAQPGEPSGGPCRDGRIISGFVIRDVAAGGAAPIADFDEGGNLRPRPEGFETGGADSLGRHSPPPPGAPGRGVRLLIMDELGFLERDSPRFQAAVFEAIRGPLPVLGTLKEMDDSSHRHCFEGPYGSENPFLEKVKACGIRMLHVTEQNRARVEKQARMLLGAWISENRS
jgi:nucleoside-triphosphatase THEP1